MRFPFLVCNFEGGCALRSSLFVGCSSPFRCAFGLSCALRPNLFRRLFPLFPIRFRGRLCASFQPIPSAVPLPAAALSGEDVRFVPAYLSAVPPLSDTLSGEDVRFVPAYSVGCSPSFRYAFGGGCALRSSLFRRLFFLFPLRFRGRMCASSQPIPSALLPLSDTLSGEDVRFVPAYSVGCSPLSAALSGDVVRYFRTRITCIANGMDAYEKLGVCVRFLM